MFSVPNVLKCTVLKIFKVFLKYDFFGPYLKILETFLETSNIFFTLKTMVKMHIVKRLYNPRFFPYS